MSKFLNRDSEGWQCARDTAFNRMVSNLKINKERYIQNKLARSPLEEEKISTEKRQEYEKIATRDELTGVYNARYIAHKLVREVKRCKRYKRPFSLVLISLDGLAHLQNLYGELTIQSIIKSSADTISSSVREVDIVGRLSIDQFIIILPETDSSRSAIVAQRIQKKMCALPFSQELNSTSLSVSIALVAFPTHGRDENDLLSTAFDYIDLAKKQGNNQIYTR